MDKLRAKITSHKNTTTILNITKQSTPIMSDIVMANVDHIFKSMESGKPANMIIDKNRMVIIIKEIMPKCGRFKFPIVIEMNDKPVLKISI